jgi:NRE family putative nickel resistance protein-like MFS transporter
MAWSGKFFSPFLALREKLFARLYIAQAVSLLGDAVTWLGIALLAFEFGGEKSAGILSVALTLRVTAYILVGPYAGVLADRLDRKKILYTTHFIRMFLVALLPFVRELWQLYTVIFLLNIFHAFFTPAFKSAIPQVISDRKNYSNAIILSNGTWQLLGMLGPGLAGGLAVWLGARQIFFFDAVTFVVAGLLILAIPGRLIASEHKVVASPTRTGAWKNISTGTILLFRNRPLRFAVMIEMIIAIAGAQVFVNTVGLVKGGMGLDDQHYGWVMMAFGIGATLAVFSSGSIDRSRNKRMILIVAAVLIIAAITAASFVPYTILLVIWVLAGMGQGFTYLPSQVMVAENMAIHEQGRVYGAHFAWTHLFWGIGYILAGITGTYLQPRSFLAGGAVALLLLIAVMLIQGGEKEKPAGE